MRLRKQIKFDIKKLRGMDIKNINLRVDLKNKEIFWAEYLIDFYTLFLFFFKFYITVLISC
ncbi:hypothetical protein A3K93_14510 (plasmid) [Acinetobacter sp. NCu2D-2]|nr:hypothetical protein A3K93_14510 [Acinetobacter sp. NCu2D-2]